MGQPASVIFGNNAQGDTMVMLSDLPDLCALLEDAAAPDTDYWVVSAWTSLPDDGPGGFATFRTADGIEEYAADWADVSPRRFRRSDGWLFLGYDPIEDRSGTLRGSLSVSFGGNGTLETPFEAVYCGAPLFNGLQ